MVLGATLGGENVRAEVTSWPGEGEDQGEEVAGRGF